MVAPDDALRTAPTEDRFGGTYKTAFAMAQALGLTHAQFYGLLHGAVFRTDEQVEAWDTREADHG